LFRIGGTLSRAPDGLPLRRCEGHTDSHQRFLSAGSTHWMVLPAASGLGQSDLHQHDVPADTTQLRRRPDAGHSQQDSLQDSQGSLAFYRVVQKTDPQFFWHNFGNSAPILTILSLLQAEIYGA